MHRVYVALCLSVLMLLLTGVPVRALAGVKAGPIVAAVQKPNVLQPQPEQVVPERDLTVQWQPVSGAAHYMVAMWTAEGGVQAFYEPFVYGTSITIPGSDLQGGERYRLYVGAVEAGGGGQGTFVFFTVQDVELPAPSVSYPTPGAVVPYEDLTIRWGTVSGAAQYIVILETIPDRQQVAYAPLLSTTSYTVPRSSLTPGGRYKLFVSANKSNGQGRGVFIEFSVENNVTPPTITSPINGWTLINPGDVTVSWNPGSGAGSYTITLKDKATGAILLNRADAGTGTSYRISANLLTGNQYEVTVCGEVCSSPVSFGYNPQVEPPQVTTPADGQVVETDDVTISWSGSVRVSAYYLTVRDTANGSLVVNRANTGTGTAYRVPKDALVPGRQYRIQVCARGGDSPEACAPELTFQYKGQIIVLPKPVVTTPSPGGTAPDGDLRVVWTASTGATTYYFTLQERGSEPLLNHLDFGDDTDTLINGNLLTSGAWYKVVICAGAPSATESCSVPVEFQYGGAPPPIDPPTITAPTAGSAVPAGDVQLSWTQSAGASSYQLTLELKATGAKILSQADFGSSTSTLLNGALLANGSTYRLTVCAAKPGTSPACSAPVEFRYGTAVLERPVVLRPTSGATVTTASLQVEWMAVQGATEYFLSVTDELTGQQPVNRVSNGSGLSAFVDGARLQAGKRYVVEVCAAAPGLQEACSPEVAFVFGANLVPPAILRPTSNETIAAKDVPVQWSASPGALTYYLTVKDAANGEARLDKLPVGNATSTTVSGNVLLTGRTYVLTVCAAANAATEVCSTGVQFVFGRPLTPPVIMKPALNDTVAAGELSLQWSATQGATNYFVTISDKVSGERPFNRVAFGNLTAATVSGSRLQTGRFYTMQVCAAASGQSEACSEPVEFRYGRPALLPPTVVRPSAGATVETADLQIEWTASEGAANYYLTIKDLASKATLLNRSPYGTSRTAKLGGDLLTVGRRYTVKVCATAPGVDEVCSPEVEFRFGTRPVDVDEVEEPSVDWTSGACPNCPVVNIAVAKGQDQPGPVAVFTLDQTTYRDLRTGGEAHQMDVAPMLYGERTLVPVYYLAQAIGVPTIEWDGQTSTVTLEKGDTRVQMVIGSTTIYINGVPKTIDVAPITIPPGRTMLPARVVAEAFGYQVGWNGVRRTVVITAPTKLVAHEQPGGRRIQVKAEPPADQIVTVSGVGGRRFRLQKDAATAWSAMVAEAHASGLPSNLLLLESGYRTVAEQQVIWDQMRPKYGSDQEARNWVAYPGSSPHHSGRAVDLYLGLANTSQNALNGSLERTEAHQWLVENAWRYGFYPYEKEPWHWEYNPPAGRT